ncbi:uncharacterized protein L201_004379 [Kwoniella dendrophila CBS 6074]|uniref:RanBD1 domain-containing protein n=1 Tax=Kwoniella dendrophila CBS 6074 TaxID=1295534 RepID=A0AAX4JVJ2_9TREE
MAKRGADNQKTREGGDSDDEQVDDPGSRSAPLAPVEGRVIRGMPKRKGLGGATPTPTPAKASTPSATPFSGFAFGGSAAPTPASSSPFVFGGSSAPAPAAKPAAAPANPFGNFSFAKPAASTTAPAPTSAAEAPKPANPFGNFSFAKPAASTTAPAPTSATEAPKPATPAFASGAEPPVSAAPASTPAAAPSNPFANFSFGKTATPAANARTSNPAAPSKPFSFGSSSTPTASSSTPAASSTPASTAAPSFSAASAPRTSPIPPSDSSSNGPLPSQPSPAPEGEVLYYTSLRGLNSSILSFLTSTLENDPFIDLSVVLPALVKQYDEHLDGEAKKAGWRPEGNKASTAINGEASKPGNGTPTPFKMPAAPASGGFALPKAPTANTSSTAPSFGGFTPTATTGGTTSGFTFGNAKPAPTPAKVETPKKPSAAVTKLVADVISGKSDENKEEDKPKSFSFGAPSSSTPESSKKGNSLFSFAPSGPIHPATPESKTFSPSATIENATPAKLGKFGPGGSQPQLAFGGAKSSPGQATPGTPAASKPFSFGFGSGSGSTVPAAASTSGGATFSFGSSSSPAVGPASGSTPSFSFGSSSTTAPKPAAAPSFSFGGSSSATTSTSTPSFSFGAKPAATSGTATPSSGFSFSSFTPKSTEEPSSSGGAGDAAEGNSELPPENAEPSKNLAETTGAGEENEDTIVEQRGKLNRLEGGEFKLEGLGQFKLKRSKEAVDGKKRRRLLMRTDGSGNVVLNMSVNGSFNPTIEGSHVRFLGFDNDGKPVSYALRVKNAEVAKKIQEELQKEVDAIKSE